MHSISAVLKTVRRLVNGVAIRVKARAQSTFPPVHAGRISNKMDRRKVPQVSNSKQIQQEIGGGLLADDDIPLVRRGLRHLLPRPLPHAVSARDDRLVGFFVALARVIVAGQNVNFPSTE
jgi:hypothetical protein